uniref:Uncharacterized protein n=1 Tax=Plectus sambesii TaxID=2011161 RepID=A0A914VX37_9BILA
MIPHSAFRIGDNDESSDELRPTNGMTDDRWRPPDSVDAKIPVNLTHHVSRLCGKPAAKSSEQRGPIDRTVVCRMTNDSSTRQCPNRPRHSVDTYD